MMIVLPDYEKYQKSIGDVIFQFFVSLQKNSKLLEKIKLFYKLA